MTTTAAVGKVDKRKRSGRKAQIIDVSTELFREKGYHATSLDDIADRIGFTKPAIYYYFKSKEDILFAIVDEIVDSGLERMEAVAATDLSPTEKMHDLLVENTRVILENLDANSVFYNERGLLSAEREEPSATANASTPASPDRSTSTVSKRASSLTSTRPWPPPPCWVRPLATTWVLGAQCGPQPDEYITGTQRGLEET